MVETLFVHGRQLLMDAPSPHAAFLAPLNIDIHDNRPTSTRPRCNRFSTGKTCWREPFNY